MKQLSIDISEKAGEVTFPVRLYPRAGRERISGLLAGKLKVEVAPAPVKNRANLALIKLLKKKLRVPRSAITIVRGASGRDKLIRVEGVTETRLREILRGNIS